MDIFTILVFFLLVNATSDEVLPSPKHIVLPDSVAETMPRKNLVITVDNEIISLQGNPVMAVTKAMEKQNKTLRPLFDALGKINNTSKEASANKAVTIMGDKNIPYALLKKIMLTCSAAKFSNLSFAVNQKQSVAKN